MQKQQMFVAVIEAFATRDTQVCFKADCCNDDGQWKDWIPAEVYLDIYRGTYEEAMMAAISDSGIPEENIRLIEISYD